MAARQLLAKVVCQVVTATQDGDRITGEQEGPRLACYSAEELVELWGKAEAEVAAQNKITQAAPSRAQRRRKQ